MCSDRLLPSTQLNGFGKGLEQPFHFALIERRLDFDGGAAGDGGGDAAALRFSSPALAASECM
jgi:hypothetical protein